MHKRTKKKKKIIVVKSYSVLVQMILYPNIEPSTAMSCRIAIIIDISNNFKLLVYSALKSKELCNAFGKLSKGDMVLIFLNCVALKNDYQD